jgi:toxin FitB
MLVDSNILIYATKPEHAELRRWLVEVLPKVSIISKVEILGYHKLHPGEKVALTELLNSLELLYLTPASYEIAIQLRQRRNLTLGDALIAATSLERGYLLATCNTGDFAWIEELKLFNPLKIG